MSNPDGFIEEVNEEVRRDRLYGLLRRYGWIGVLVIVLIVGGAAYSEYSKAQAKARAEALGDGMLAALSQEDRSSRVAALAALEAPTPLSAVVLEFMTAAEQFEAGDAPAAIATLDAISVNGDVPDVYRQLAQFKAVTLQGSDTPVADRRQALEAMAQPGNRLRLLAAEQLALIDIETGDTAAAVDRYQAILSDAEVSTDLQQRALQVIVALGGEPELTDAMGLNDAGMSDSGN